MVTNIMLAYPLYNYIVYGTSNGPQDDIGNFLDPYTLKPKILLATIQAPIPEQQPIKPQAAVPRTTQPEDQQHPCSLRVQVPNN